MKVYLLFFVSFLLIISLGSSAFGCTIFNASNTDTVLVGNNEDWNNTNTGVCFLPPKKVSLDECFLDISPHYLKAV